MFHGTFFVGVDVGIAQRWWGVNDVVNAALTAEAEWIFGVHHLTGEFVRVLPETWRNLLLHSIHIDQRRGRSGSRMIGRPWRTGARNSRLDFWCAVSRGRLHRHGWHVQLIADAAHAHLVELLAESLQLGAHVAFVQVCVHARHHLLMFALQLLELHLMLRQLLLLL